MKHRPERASALIIEELGKIILKEVEIPDTLVTITGVEVTKDLSQATVKISVYPSEKTAETLREGSIPSFSRSQSIIASCSTPEARTETDRA